MIRPPGTTGLPSPRVSQLKTTIKLNHQESDLAKLYASALGALLEEMKQTGSGKKRYRLGMGTRVRVEHEKTFYNFQEPEEVLFSDNADIELQIGRDTFSGSIVSLSSGGLQIEVEGDLGEIAQNVVLIKSDTFLLKLVEKIKAVETGAVKLNRGLADAVVGKASPPPSPAAISGRYASSLRLNADQSYACSRALSAALTFIWGPPGCGKTQVLAEIVQSAIEGGKRILICSNTNKAVDQILYRVCNNLGRSHPLLTDGKLIRIGSISDDKLTAEFATSISLDAVYERRSSPLTDLASQVRSRANELRAHADASQKILNRFSQLDEANKSVISLQSQTNSIADSGRRLELEAASLQRQLEDLLAELNRTGSILSFFKRGRALVEQDLASVHKLLQINAEGIHKLKADYTATKQRFDKAVEKRDKLRNEVQGLDRANLERVLIYAKEQVTSLTQQLQNIEGRITGLHNEILSEARVLGATCTTTYLLKDIGSVDFIIFDEASMVLLPVIWYVAGLSSERVVICGDSRQLPPVISTEQRAIADVIGKDVFTSAGLGDPEKQDPRLVMLTEQYRMHSQICDLVSGPMYGGRLRTAKERSESTDRELPAPFNQALTLVDTSRLGPFERYDESNSRFNLLHALLIRNISNHIGRQGLLPDRGSLAVCTPYKAQSKLIRTILGETDFGELVQVGTVHSFQGDERRALIFEVPEGNGGHQLGQPLQGVPPFDQGARLINVAISRAQNQLIMVANLSHMDRLLPSHSLLREVLHTIEYKGKVIEGTDILALQPIAEGLRHLVQQKDTISLLVPAIFTQTDFAKALYSDILSAQTSILIFSGFITAGAVARIGDLLRLKIAEGVVIRCVTRPYKYNGGINPESGKDALDSLENIGCSVDCRAGTHEKLVIIDGDIVWQGSLNLLSHTGKTDEILTRLASKELARGLAERLAKRPLAESRDRLAPVQAENPRCTSCGSRTYYREGRYGGFFTCEECERTCNLMAAQANRC